MDESGIRFIYIYIDIHIDGGTAPNSQNQIFSIKFKFYSLYILIDVIVETGNI